MVIEKIDVEVILHGRKNGVKGSVFTLFTSIQSGAIFKLENRN